MYFLTKIPERLQSIDSWLHLCNYDLHLLQMLAKMHDTMTRNTHGHWDTHLDAGTHNGKAKDHKLWHATADTVTNTKTDSYTDSDKDTGT